MRIIFLGTSASVPTRERGLSSIAVLRGSELLLFDAGEGVQRALSSANLGFNRKMRVFITHLHGDHCIGLLGLLQTMSMVDRSKVIDIYGPPRLKSFLKYNIQILKIHPTFPIQLYIVREGIVLEESEYLVRACKAQHSITSYAYCLEEKNRPGIFHHEKAIELGVPKGRLWSILQKGGRVVVGGRTITSSEVLGQKRQGRKIGISGDTRPIPRFQRFFKGCDILIFDSTYGDDHADKAMENLHSTAREGAYIAKKAQVKTLILTHFSARYDDPNLLVAQASQVHGDVRAAQDSISIEVPYND
jgi:ribonuclease Z